MEWIVLINIYSPVLKIYNVLEIWHIGLYLVETDWLISHENKKEMI